MPIDLDAVTRQLSTIHLRSIVESTARINIWNGSVRSGKTVSSLLRFMMAVANAPTSGRILIFGKTRESIARNIFAVLQDPALFGQLAHTVHYNPGAATAMILGRVVDVIGANDAKAEPKVRGMTLCIAYGDELTTIPEDFFKQVLARLSVKGAQLFGTTNPDSRNHWLRKKFLLRVGELDLRTWHSTLDDNPHLEPAYVANLKIEYTGLWYQRFILGKWVMAEGAIYDMWDEEKHLVTDQSMPAITRWVSLGVDYGTTNPFDAIALGLGSDQRLYLGREWRWDSGTKHRKLTDSDYSKRLRAWVTAQGFNPEWWCVDPSATSFRTQLLDDGIVSHPADNSVLDGIRLVASLFAQDALRVHESCAGLIDEIGGYSWDPDKSELGLDEPIKLDDHACDAMRYAIKTSEVIWRPHVRASLALAA